MKTNYSTMGRRRHSLPRAVRPLIECNHCKGSGKVSLGDEMMLTLDALRFLKRATTEEVATAILWQGHITAVNNRLAYLERQGLARRWKFGREWRYEAV